MQLGGDTVGRGGLGGGCDLFGHRVLGRDVLFAVVGHGIDRIGLAGGKKGFGLLRGVTGVRHGGLGSVFRFCGDGVLDVSHFSGGRDFCLVGGVAGVGGGNLFNSVFGLDLGFGRCHFRRGLDSHVLVFGDDVPDCLFCGGGGVFG